MECSEFRAFFWAFTQSPTILPIEDCGHWLRDCIYSSDIPRHTQGHREGKAWGGQLVSWPQPNCDPQFEKQLEIKQAPIKIKTSSDSTNNLSTIK